MRSAFVCLVGAATLVLGACSGGTVEDVEQSPPPAPAGCKVVSVEAAVVAQCGISGSKQLNYSDYVTGTLNPWLAQQGNTQVGDSSHVWVEAAGGQGALGNGHDCVHTSGKGGTPGYTNTTRTSSELSGKTLYLYVGSGGLFADATCGGSGGGASTMVLTVAISDQAFDFDTNALLIAGGGGGGSSQCDVPSVSGRAGGSGGVAIAGGGSDVVSAAGGKGSGNGGKGGNSNQSKDGTPDGGGEGGSGAKDGATGVGGSSGKSRHAAAVGWVNVDGVDKEAADWTKGAGGNSNTSNDSGASGGGGYGGGGGGRNCSGTSTDPGGGGGGGSFASAGTVPDPNIPTTYSGSQQGDGNGDNGKIKLSWVLN